ncbi:hypothetical protein C4565_07870 [Candidatus Parcubacteria bacterium]|nr:MAG: hypothetical protein C4565_07870 [Candidatus Parcubacteria bacterium]
MENLSYFFGSSVGEKKGAVLDLDAPFIIILPFSEGNFSLWIVAFLWGKSLRSQRLLGRYVLT